MKTIPINKSTIKNINIFMIVVLLVCIASCNDKTKDTAESQKELKDRKLNLLIDESVFNLTEKPVMQFDSIDANCEVTYRKVTAWDAMAKLLSGETDAIILPRENTKYEDSMMKAFKVKPLTKVQIAFDALVFYSRYENPADTITDKQLTSILTDKNSSFMKYYPKLKEEPEFVSNKYISSEYENLKSIVLKGNSIKKRIKFFGTSDSVINYVKSNPGSIGIGYLSQILKQPELKPLRISYTDSTGNYIFPRVVHQANIVRKLYPYIITLYIYVADEKKDAAMRLARYLSKNGNAQKYFLDQGIAPAFAKIKLIDEG